ncbi:MAG: M13 family metallopeptidase [Dokdonella sp.]|uniref:M13 family metallopeptidase n=1 Tax=Dokdonella sp. TaxID=2291710 RepID=UPI003265D8A2
MPACSKRTLAAALVLSFASGAQAHTNDHGLDALNFDPAVGACTDFFQHANGGWLASNPIGAQYSQWSLDDELRERNLGLVREVLDNAAAHPGADGSSSRKIGDFYASAIDEESIEAAGYTRIKPDLARVDALKTPADVAALVRLWHAQGVPVLFEFGPESDMKNAGVMIGYASQGGLGLPDRDYYTRTDAKSKALRGTYRTHVARMLGLIGEKDPRTAAGWIVDLETTLAKSSLDRTALRDPLNSYHLVTVKAADAQTPHFSWTAFYTSLGRDDVVRFSLAQPMFFAAADKALASVPIAHWQAYLRWHLLDSAAPDLSTAFVDEDFDFHGRTLRGTQELKPRWKRAVDSTNDALGFAVGEAYVARTFPPEARERARKLVENLKIALRARLAHLDWMGDDTKNAAYAKLDTLVAKIGYPDTWRDYSTLPIQRGAHYANVRAALAFEAHRTIAKIDKPVDRSEWGMLPQTVNAYYNPLQNEIVFPAAQLQPPYFDATMDEAINYGGIGAVIGHEMLHGFDDQGSQFDAQGNLRDWWSTQDRDRFNARTARLVKQFDAYVPVDDLHINGTVTLGENIADLGGIEVAWDAFRLTDQSKAAAPIDGYSPSQRFFLSFAQSWRTQQRPEALRLQVQSNEHAPAKYRVNGPVSNLPSFADAFACKTGEQPMARATATHVDIW